MTDLFLASHFRFSRARIATNRNRYSQSRKHQYTPAPDIVHEAAGHAPILLDPTYAKYVKRFGQIGAKAFYKEEHDAFEAVRTLTIVKESPTSTPDEVTAAENNVIEKQNLVSGLSEAEQISRLFWWTVEYGLIGDIDNPKIYGAGLLSSVGESKHLLNRRCRKGSILYRGMYKYNL